MQLLASGLILLAMAGEGAALGTGAALNTGAALGAAAAAASPRQLVPRPVQRLQLPPAVLALRLVPDWRHWLTVTPGPGPLGLVSVPGPAFERRLQLRWVYRRLVELPELDRVGRLAHVDFPDIGLSGGPELLRRALEPPRDDYYRVEELTPGWSWYISAERWAVGVSTGTRFLILDQVGTIVDPFTSEARWAFFLP